MMNVRMIGAAVAVLLNLGFIAVSRAQESTLIGLQDAGIGQFSLVTVQTSTGQITPLASAAGVAEVPTTNYGYNSVTNTYSFAYYPSVSMDVERLRTVSATTGQTISDVELAAIPTPASVDYQKLAPLAPNLGNFSTVVASTSVTTPVITATTANIQTANIGGAINVATGATVNMGGNTIQDVGNPVAPTDAANKQYVDNAIGGVASSFNSGLNEAFKKIDQNSQGIAVAMAMSGLSLSSDKNALIGGNVGFYDGKQAVAFQGAVRLIHNITFNGGIGFGLDDNSPVGARLGFQVEF
jgi:hypothetical protein